MLRRVPIVLRSLWGRRKFEDALGEELRFHIEAYAEDLVRSGVPPAEASRRARAEFGGVELVKDDCRRARGLRLFDDARQDATYAVRTMRRAPVFTLTAVGSIALCLGANLAAFAVVNAILLRPLPFPQAERLVRVFNSYPKAGVPDDGASVTNYYERRGALAAFEGVSFYREGRAMIGPAGDVPPTHGPTLAAAAATIVIVSVAACMVPSRRAARISPLEALNES